MLKNRTLGLLSLLIALSWAGSAQAQYALTYNSGGQLQIGTGLPLPVGTAGIFLGGMTSMTAGTFPPLLINPDPLNTMAIAQNQSTGQGGKMVIPAGVLRDNAVVPRDPIAVFTTNPVVFQVRTSLNYAWPLAAATFAPGGAPGAAATTVVITGPGGTIANPATITYSGSTKAFGGAARFALSAGAGAGTFRLPPHGTMVPIATVHINYLGAVPSMATMALIAGASNPAGFAQPGGPVASPAGTTMYGPVVAAEGGFANVVVGSMGTILMSTPLAAPAPSNMVTASKGFPWTTGFITLSQPNAGPAEIFFLSGTDNRVAGIGNVQLVSGALSTRKLSGPNANRGWLSLSLPEPTAALGAAGALAMLGLCHGLVRRRSS